MSFFNIPTDTYSSSSSGFNQDMAKDLWPSLLSNFNQQPSFNFGDIGKYTKQASEAYEPAFGMVSDTFGKARESLPGLYKNALIPSTQNTLNDLSSRGILNSSMGSDAISNMSRNIAGDVAGQQSSLYGQEAGMLGSLAGAQASAGNELMGSLLSMIMGRESSDQGLIANLIGNMGKYSESSDPFEPYQAMINLLSGQL
jgi:hypothetical protein